MIDQDNEESVNRYLKLKKALSKVHHTHALIIAAMRSKNTASTLVNYIEHNDKMPFSQDIDHKKILSYMYKIKQLHDDTPVTKGDCTYNCGKKSFLNSCIEYMKYAYSAKYALIIGMTVGFVGVKYGYTYVADKKSCRKSKG